MNRLNESRLKLYNTYKVAVEQHSDIFSGEPKNHNQVYSDGHQFFGFPKERVNKLFKQLIEVVEAMSDEEVLQEQAELDDYIRWFEDAAYRAAGLNKF